MTNDRWQISIVGVIVFGAGLVFLNREGLNLTNAMFIAWGLGALLIGGWPIWAKIFKRKE